MIYQFRQWFSRRCGQRISPLKDEDVNSFRYPGQSAQVMMDRISDDSMEDLAMLILIISPTLQL